MTPRPDPLTRFYPESAAGGFSRNDGTVAFYQRVQALLRPDSVVIDFGAGRGQFLEDPVPMRRDLQLLRARAAEVIGLDLDPAVLENPALTSAHIIESGSPLPVADESADLVVSDWTFEHVTDPFWLGDELYRVLRQEQDDHNHLPHRRQAPTTHRHQPQAHLHALTLSNPLKTAKSPNSTPSTSCSPLAPGCLRHSPQVNSYPPSATTSTPNADTAATRAWSNAPDTTTTASSSPPTPAPVTTARPPSGSPKSPGQQHDQIRLSGIVRSLVTEHLGDPDFSSPLL